MKMRISNQLSWSSEARSERKTARHAALGVQPPVMPSETSGACDRGQRRPKRMSTRRSARAAERGSVLVIVMLIAFGVISMALYFSNSMSMELRASDNRASGLAADQAIEGAARYVGYILTQFATNGAVPDPSEYQAEAVPVGDAAVPEQNAHFWIIGRDPSETASSEPYFGLIDEASKLNLNVADSNMLACLPNMTTDFADAIVDWRDTNSSMSLDYSMLGYLPKGAPFETVDELRLVYGATVDFLAGEDINRNGVLDANETDLNGNGVLDSGLFEYTTVYTREPNFHSDGTMLTNVNDPNALRSLLQTELPSRASQILQNLGYGGAGGGGTGGGQQFTNLLQFYLASQMTSADFDQIYGDITVSSSLYTSGLINVNTASTAVLNALFLGIGVDQSAAADAAQQLVNYREQQDPDTLLSFAWIVDVLGRDSPVIRALARGNYITAHTFQFTADIAALGPYGRGYRRVKFVFDLSEGTPRIIYRQDLSRLGWALGADVRKTWVAQNSR